MAILFDKNSHSSAFINPLVNKIITSNGYSLASTKPGKVTNNDLVIQETKRLVQKADLIIAANASELKLEDIVTLRKLLPTIGDAKVSVVSKQILIESIDSTPFCLMNSGLLFGNNFCAFIKGTTLEASRDGLSKWLRQLKSGGSEDKPLHVIIATRSLCVKLDY